MSAWQPINTVPTDLEVLVAHQWPNGSWGFQIDQRDADGEWQILDGDERNLHWMPMPAPPVST